MHSYKERCYVGEHPVRAVLLTAFAMTVLLAGSRTRAEDTVRAVWQVQEIRLPYFGTTTIYSCDGLRDKMKSILHDLVGKRYAVTILGCADPSRPQPNLTVSMVVASPMPATDENVKAVANDTKHAELLARLKRKGAEPIGNEAFDAVTKRVVLRVKAPGSGGGSGDCELLEQVRSQVLNKLGAKVIKDEVSCVPHQGVAGNPELVVDVLAPAAAKS